MGESVIKVKNLSKVYNIYERPIYRLYDMLSPLLSRISNKFHEPFHRKFAALSNVSFELKRGESIGFIGKNGAGKSTLLQIIAGTLSQTSGEVEVNGRVNALLELGSGFNPEFTGRENVYMNGTILGFSKEYMDSKFQEIHEFSEVGEFIDQPVKTYSSGMFVKLAFSVQALLDPEILIVDEALSVGDIFFQRKCHQIIQKLLSGNTTFIFVSHDMSSIVKYCQKSILLNAGEVLYYGDSLKATSLYFKLDRLSPEEIKQEAEELNNPTVEKEIPIDKNQSGIPYLSAENCEILSGNYDQIRFLGYILLDEQSKVTNSFTIQDKVSFHFKFQAMQDMEAPILSLSIYNRQNITIFGKYAYQFKNVNIPDKLITGQIIEVEVKLQLDLYPDQYIFSIGIITMNEFDLKNIESFSLQAYQDKFTGVVTIQVGTFVVSPPKKGIYLPFNGLSDLPSECKYTVRD
jgi:ABC-type polysaccharide/polyol phosphate transport system ATPase subunit